MTKNSTPNVLFIMADQMKASILRMYSEIGIETPALERLASEGVRFEHAITPHPLCVPARTSVMTGRYPHSTGCRRNETLMPENEQHAFRIWKNNGFVTGLIGKNHCFIEPGDLELFDVRCEIAHQGLPKGAYAGENVGNTGMEWVVPESDIDAAHEGRVTLREHAQSPRIAYRVSDAPEEHFGTAVIATQTEEFLDRYSRGEYPRAAQQKSESELAPFALWVSFPDPHEPFEAPRRYVDMFPPVDVVLPPQRTDEYTDGTSPERNRVLARMMRQTDDLEEHRRGVISVYQAMTRFVDDGISRILDKLDELGLRDNTIVVFTADHGDFMGEHGMAVKGGVFYDCLVRVPMIVSWPGGGVPQGVVDGSMTSTLDILPTLLELQGLASFNELGAGWARAGTGGGRRGPDRTDRSTNPLHAGTPTSHGYFSHTARSGLRGVRYGRPSGNDEDARWVRAAVWLQHHHRNVVGKRGGRTPQDGQDPGVEIRDRPDGPGRDPDIGVRWRAGRCRRTLRSDQGPLGTPECGSSAGKRRDNFRDALPACGLDDRH